MAGDPAWVGFGGAGLGASLAGQARLQQLPPAHRARPWLWAGTIATMAFACPALIAQLA